ncbi:hypothetical protein [Puniceibacterium confluentis]|nr:hypothetical protein [Puniceibacterium confluentis]
MESILARESACDPAFGGRALKSPTIIADGVVPQVDISCPGTELFIYSG